MCGIVGAIAERNVASILVEGLKRLEYRGYDSAGLVLIDHQQMVRERQLGKVGMLESAVHQHQLKGTLGIAHTRWATHGAPSTENAHPHVSGEIAVAHNGIIENYQVLKQALIADGYVFSSQTDTEVVVHLIHQALHHAKHPSLLAAVNAVLPKLQGAFALGIVSTTAPDELIAVRRGSPLIVGVGIGEHFIASDQLALLPVTNRFIYLEEGDVVRLTRDHIEIFHQNQPVERTITTLDILETQADKGPYKHFMLKEIFEQPEAIARGLAAALENEQLKSDFLFSGNTVLSTIQRVQIVACGTSYHAGLIARYWFEALLKLPCQVEIASEYRYRGAVIEPNTLLICISQSGETADTLAALKNLTTTARDRFTSLAICNVATSSLVRESDLALLTLAGPEIGVASTKAFTTQLLALLLLVLKIGDRQQRLSADQHLELVNALLHLPSILTDALRCHHDIQDFAHRIAEKQHAIFLGRGVQFPIALEGALKLKEISYIHAEGYAAGELKHGPLALIDPDMPIIVLMPEDNLAEKLRSNIEEVLSRGGELFVFTNEKTRLQTNAQLHTLEIPSILPWLAPIVMSIPVQLLSYHVAVLRGTDVDQPRNLAKSVTVE